MSFGAAVLSEDLTGEGSTSNLTDIIQYKQASGPPWLLDRDGILHIISMVQLQILQLASLRASTHRDDTKDGILVPEVISHYFSVFFFLEAVT